MPPKPQDIDALLLAAAEKADALMAQGGGTDTSPDSLVDQVVAALKPSFGRLPEPVLRKAVEQYLGENPKLKTVEDVVSAINGRDLMTFRSVLARIADEQATP